MKPIIQKLWMVMAMLWAFIPASAYDFEVDGIYYNITSMADLEVEVTFGSKAYNGAIVIPAAVNYNNRTFSVIGIGYNAFDYDGITSISLPECIRYIGSKAFYKCTMLTSISIPSKVTTIGNHAFGSSGLKSAVIGESVNSIGQEAFYGCTSLMEVFYTGDTAPQHGSNVFAGANRYLERYVPSVKVYGFGREYLTFATSSYDYTGHSHNIEWSNNLKAYKCDISEAECHTETNAGQYTKKLLAKYSDGIDLSVEIPFDYTINKAQMTLTVHNAEREYGEPNPVFTCDISGFVNGENVHTLAETPAYECEATRISKVGDYRILASLNAPNYEVTYKYGTLSVVKAPLTVGVAGATKIYGNQNPDFALTFTGLKNGETAPEWSVKPVVSTKASVSSGVGQYPVNAADGVAVNYEVAGYVPGTLTVTRRDLTAKAIDCERFYNEENPAFGISYIGFVNGDSEQSLTKRPVAYCPATKASDAGTYPIVVSGGEADNYSFVYQDGSLRINPLSVGFKNTYNTVTYYDMALSTDDGYFNYIPEITGPFNQDDFIIELWFLDKDNKFGNHVATITSGEYAGNYVNTNSNRPMWAGKYIFNLVPTGANPNVSANPSRAYLTVSRASNNLEWNADSPITVRVGEKVDLGITYQADIWCMFNTDYDEKLIALSSENEMTRDPHWYVTGLKEGTTTLYFGIECRKNDMGFYDFSDSRTLSKRIKVEPAAGVDGVVSDEAPVSVKVKDGAICIINKNAESVVRVFSIQGMLVAETLDDVVDNLSKGLYIVTVGTRSLKITL
ncbi:MAG: MBG domain-containing protein [Bacteroidales bacterium]|nr:MBG domain-containing protein [Bacteroidales bacterium]